MWMGVGLQGWRGLPKGHSPSFPGTVPWRLPVLSSIPSPPPTRPAAFRVRPGVGEGR